MLQYCGVTKLSAEQRLHGANHDAEHGKTENAVLNPSTCKMNYTNVFVGRNFSGFRLFQFPWGCLRLGTGRSLNQGFNRVKLRSGR